LLESAAIAARAERAVARHPPCRSADRAREAVGEAHLRGPTVAIGQAVELHALLARSNSAGSPGLALPIGFFAFVLGRVAHCTTKLSWRVDAQAIQ
jgi:hypothetical protein